MAKTLRLNKNVYMKITERRKDSTGREFKESEFDDESTLRQSTLNKQFNWVQQTNSKRYNRLHTAVDSMCKKQSFGQSVSSFC